MKRIMFAVLAYLAFAIPAQAQLVSKPTFQTGLYLGVNGGYQVGTNELDLNTAGPGSLLNLDGLSTRGVVYGAHGGFDFRIANSPFLVGIVGSYQFGEAEFDISSAALGVNVLHATIEPTWKVGGRVGYVLGNGSMIYGGYQYANAKLGITSGLVPGSLSYDLTGHNPFIGIELPITDFVTVGMQYDYTKYDTERLASFGPLNLDLDAEVHAVSARVNVRLQGLFQ
jgi:opacity protein-like surface antigen